MASGIMNRIAPLLTKVKGAVEPVYSKIQKEGLPVVQKSYAELLEANKKYVVQDAAQASVLHKQLIYTNLAKIPKHVEAAKAEAALWKQTVENVQELTVKECAAGAWFAFEVYAFFVVGEIAGRGWTLIDYEVPGML